MQADIWNKAYNDPSKSLEIYFQRNTPPVAIPKQWLANKNKANAIRPHFFHSLAFSSIGYTQSHWRTCLFEFNACILIFNSQHRSIHYWKYENQLKNKIEIFCALVWTICHPVASSTQRIIRFKENPLRIKISNFQ